MLKWALIFFVISVIAGLLGFTGISAASAGIAKILFYIAVVIFLIFLALALFAGQRDLIESKTSSWPGFVPAMTMPLNAHDIGRPSWLTGPGQ